MSPWRADIQTADMATNLKTYIGSAIRAHRNELGWTQEKLAEKADKSVEAISNIERGFALPGLKALETIASALGVDLRDLLPQPGYGEIGAERLRKEQEAAAILRHLSDRELAIALAQLKALKAGV